MNSSEKNYSNICKKTTDHNSSLMYVINHEYKYIFFMLNWCIFKLKTIKKLKMLFSSYTKLGVSLF